MVCDSAWYVFTVQLEIDSCLIETTSFSAILCIFDRKSTLPSLLMKQVNYFNWRRYTLFGTHPPDNYKNVRFLGKTINLRSFHKICSKIRCFPESSKTAQNKN